MRKKIISLILATVVMAICYGNAVYAYDIYPELTQKEKEGIIQRGSALGEQIEEECKQGLNHNATAQNSEAARIDDHLHTYGEEFVVRELIVNFGINSVDPYSPDNPRFGYGWFDQRNIQFYVDEYHVFGSYVSLLREAGFNSVDYTVAINESLAHGEITKAEADALLRGEMVITQRAAQAIADNINNPYFTSSVPECVKMYQSGNFISATTLSDGVKVTDYSAVMYTVEGTNVCTEPDTSKVLLLDIGGGLPVEVTGITDNGFFRVVIAGAIYYIAGGELVTQK